MSAPAEYYDRYWSDEGYRPTGSLPPALEQLFAVRIPASAHCLDLGCGDGRTAGVWLARHAAAYVGVDISQPAIDEARSLGLDARLVEDAGELPFEEAEFDVVVCIEVLEHLLEPQRAASEALRVLRAGGTFLASVPNVAYWRRRLELGLLARWNPFGDDLSTREPWRDPHIRFFTPKTLKRMLEEKGGFTDVMTRGVGGSLLAEVPALRRFLGGDASSAYHALERTAPTLFGARILAVARKPGPFV